MLMLTWYNIFLHIPPTVQAGFLCAGRCAVQAPLGSEEGDQAGLVLKWISLSRSQVLQRRDGRFGHSSAPVPQLVLILLSRTLKISTGLSKLLWLHNIIFQHLPICSLIIFFLSPLLGFLKFSFAIVTCGACILCVHLFFCFLHQKVTLISRFPTEFSCGIRETL